jgi:NAD dependent epimerase/dehydratase family enzyme
VGTGDQVFSWIGLDDAIYAIHHLIRTESVRGPVNVVAPGALPQREFARELGRVLGRPAVVPLPAFAVRALFGQMGEETLLSGQFVEPGVLRRSGFSWDLPLGEAFTR